MNYVALQDNIEVPRNVTVAKIINIKTCYVEGEWWSKNKVKRYAVLRMESFQTQLLLSEFPTSNDIWCFPKT